MSLHQIPVEIPCQLPTPTPGACLHNRGLSVVCSHTYLEDSHRYTLELRATCDDCGVPFRFDQLPHAIFVTKACRDFSGITASLPIVPDEDLRMYVEPDWPREEG